VIELHSDIAAVELDELEEESATEAAPSVPRTDAEIETAYLNISFRVIYQSHNFLLPQIKDIIEKREVINLRPEYQRRLRWAPKKRSQLIESLFLNIPIPPIFLFESELARYEVMDGQQRLNAIHTYLSNDFSLVGLEKLVFLNGKRYNKLPPKLRRALDRASLSAIVLLQETRSDSRDPYVVRRYVFERLNSGGEKLNPQEMRNSLYRGDFNKLIVRLSRNKDFCDLFGIPAYTETDENEYYENPLRQSNTLYKTMGDCQIVLRFFAFSDDQFISGSVREMLDRCMARNTSVDRTTIAAHEKSFVSLIEKAHTIFGTSAFVLDGGDSRPRLSVALYDAIMGALVRRKDELDRIVEKAQSIRLGVERVKRDQRNLLTGQANTAQSIKDRIASVVAVIDAAIGP
jgi:hypothetical protein